ncbi:MAG: carboxypeptidase regulatory-like domain-containing protein [Bacteroidales bacterium]
MRSRRWGVRLATVLMVLALAGSLRAQEFRGAITGIVTDATQGALPGVTVSVVNNATKVSNDAVTDASGRYQFRYLNPGSYTVTAKLDGFKTSAQTVEVRVGDTITADMKLEVGGITETVQVVAEAPLLNTTTAVRGQVIESKQIQELPLADGTAYMLTRLAPGIADSSDLHFARPGDNGNLAGIVANGVQGGNEFSIDGAPNTSNARGVGFSPPSDAIEQFRVQTNAFDAQTGHTAGAVVNLAIKSGTNMFRGAGGYFNRDASRTAMPLLTKRADGDKPERTYNRFSGAVGGPIVKNKTFFMGSFEHLRDVQSEPATYTVPTEKMRKGDLSEFSVLIYDPATVKGGGSSTRQPFANNLIPAYRVDPVAAAYASYYPLPNRASTESNYFTNQLRPYDYNAAMGRVDHNFNGANRLFVTGYWNKRREDRYNWAQDATNAVDGKINGFGVTQGFDYRSNQGLTLGYTTTLRPTFLVDVRGAWARFGEWRQNADSITAAKLGFSSTAQQLMADYSYLPLMTIGSFSTTNSNSTIAALGAQRSDWGTGFNRPFQTYTFAPTATRVVGNHTAKFGYDFRKQLWDITNAGFPGGRYQFNGAYTRLNNSAPTNDRAQAWAQFMLGLPTANTGAVATPGTQSSQFEIASLGAFSQTYHHLFVQDDWRVGPKLTLNAGLRLEINTGMSEAEDRNLAGFDTVVSNPIEPDAQAAYAKNPIPEIPVSSFKVPGGLLYTSGPVNKTATKLLPRGAASYSLNEKTVLRGGVGLFSYDYFFDNINQLGYSQATPVLVTQDNGLTFTGATLSNPIPSGQLIQPVGSANGLKTALGTNLGTLYQPDRKTPYYIRTELNVQHELGQRWVVAFTYIYSHGSDLPVARQTNNIPTQYLSTSRYRDTAQEAYLSQNVSNPFAGLVPGSTMNGSMVQRQQLLRPYPEFGTFAIEEYTGSDRYQAATIQLDKQFRGGNSLTVQYTRSSLHDTLNYLNPQPGQPLEDRVSPNDRPNRFTIGTSLQIPVGHGQKWGATWNPVLDAVLGGWRVSGTYQYQTGFPLSFNNSLYYDSSCGDPASLLSNIGEKTSKGIAGLDFPAWNTSCFYFHDAPVQTNGVDDPVKQRADPRIQMGNNVRYFPSTLPNMRTDNLHLLDLGLTKNFALTSQVRMQLRFEALNALNYTVLWNPNVDPRNALFGYVNQERNNPRDVQIGVRITF